MTAVNNGLSTAQVQASIIAKLINLRNALADCAELYGWTSGLAQADMEAAAGLSAADATAYLSAVADANALNDYYSSAGHPVSGSYPQPASDYSFGASQRAVIGPQ